MLSATVLSWCSVFSPFLVLSLHVFCQFFLSYFFSSLLLHFCHRFFCVLFFFSSGLEHKRKSAFCRQNDSGYSEKMRRRKKKREAVRVLLHYILCVGLPWSSSLYNALSFSLDKSQCLNSSSPENMCVYLWCKSKERENEKKKTNNIFYSTGSKTDVHEDSIQHTYIFLCDLVLVLFVCQLLCLVSCFCHLCLSCSLSEKKLLSVLLEWYSILVVVRCLGCTICMHWMCVCHNEIIVKFYTARNYGQYARYMYVWILDHCASKMCTILMKKKSTWK